MSSGIELVQGTDRDIVVKHDDSTLTSATEIEVVIDTPTQIVKTLSGGGISSVSSSQFTISITNADTKDRVPGEYSIESRATKSGKLIYGEIRPGYVLIIDSKFTNTA